MKKQCDVLIVGGGPSGISAALAAAQSGCSVVLAEEDQSVGGAPVDMYVCMACGGPRRGFYKELLRYLDRTYPLDGEPEEGFTGDENGNNRWWLPYDYARAYQHFLSAHKNIEVVTGFCARRVLVAGEDGSVRVVGAADGEGEDALEIFAKVTVDATGTGILGELAGCDVRYGTDARADFDEPAAPAERSAEIMPCTLKFIAQRLYGNRMPSEEEIRAVPWSAGFVEDKLFNWSNNVYPIAVRNNRGVYLHWGASVKDVDTRSARSLAAAYSVAFEHIGAAADLWRKYGFKVYVAPKIGVRECRRVMGDAVVTMHTIVGGEVPQDAVAFSSYGFDLWGSTVRDEKALNRKARFYGIPYRALVPKGAEGLLMAGKSISGSHLACSSYRVQPIVTCIGEAAGYAAADAAQRGVSVRAADIARLQARLKVEEIMAKF